MESEITFYSKTSYQLFGDFHFSEIMSTQFVYDLFDKAFSRKTSSMIIILIAFLRDVSTYIHTLKLAVEKKNYDYIYYISYILKNVKKCPTKVENAKLLIEENNIGEIDYVVHTFDLIDFPEECIAKIDTECKK